jgi:hypothetical protein
VTITEPPNVDSSLIETIIPTNSPTHFPTYSPLVAPFDHIQPPSRVPTDSPTVLVSDSPTIISTSIPTNEPSMLPSSSLTIGIKAPSYLPTICPSDSPTGRPSIPQTIVPTGFVLLPPVIASISSSADLRSITLTFSASTNKGGQANSFTCSSFFQFSGAESAKCEWNSASLLTIYPDLSTSASVSSALAIGSTIKLLSTSNIQAICPSPVLNICSSFPKITEQLLIVPSPVKKLKPQLVLQIPNKIGGCDSVIIDLTGSVGDGGRGWTDIDIKADGLIYQSDTSFFVAKVQSMFTTLLPIVIPQEDAMLQIGESYTLRVKMCNFLAECQTVNSTFSVTATESNIDVFSIILELVIS